MDCTAGGLTSLPASLPPYTTDLLVDMLINSPYTCAPNLLPKYYRYILLVDKSMNFVDLLFVAS